MGSIDEVRVEDALQRVLDELEPSNLHVGQRAHEGPDVTPTRPMQQAPRGHPRRRASDLSSAETTAPRRRATDLEASQTPRPPLLTGRIDDEDE
jgi:hypothetical protein